MDINDFIEECVTKRTKKKGSCSSCIHSSYDGWQEYCKLVDNGDWCTYKQKEDELIRAVREDIKDILNEEYKRCINKYIDENISKEYKKYIPSKVDVWI